jgi:hypothetical protein
MPKPNQLQQLIAQIPSEKTRLAFIPLAWLGDRPIQSVSILRDLLEPVAARINAAGRDVGPDMRDTVLYSALVTAIDLLEAAEITAYNEAA